MSMSARICVSLGGLPFDRVLALLPSSPLAEVRMDLLNFTRDQYQLVFAQHKNLIATCRPGSVTEPVRAQLLMDALSFGAAFVDLEIECDSLWRMPIVEYAHSLGRKVILSYHNYEFTPSGTELRAIVESIFDAGADVAKIACMALSPLDSATILSLYAHYTNLVAIGMGAEGRMSRVAAPFLGAPFTFAAVKGSATALGQLAADDLNAIFNLLE